MYIGFSLVLCCSAKAASWNAPTIDPLVIHPKEPPCLALSSLNLSATLAKEEPAFRAVRASKIFDCFSHRI